MTRKYRAIGLMSGTSIDGIDVAMIETDGYGFVRPMGFFFEPYEKDFRDDLRQCFGKKEGVAEPLVRRVEEALTQKHAQAVNRFLTRQAIEPSVVDFVGFHGQTIWHNPIDRETVQIGDGALLAEETGIAVVNDFRTADVKAGGQGAPLVPLYHRALAYDLPKPLAIVNIGGVSNVTWIGGDADDQISAFDLGPGNALLDDWILTRSGNPFDEDGALAQAGRVDDAFVARFMEHPYFEKKPPKSLDRDAFARYVPTHLSLEDGAATLTMLTVSAIAHGLLRQVPCRPEAIYVGGGGRRNATMMRWLAAQTGAKVKSVDELGWCGDALEAEAFAYLAVRSALGLPLSLPATTACPRPMTGGQLHLPQKKRN